MPRSPHPSSSRYALTLALVALVGAGVLPAVEAPERSGVGEKAFRHPDLEISTILRLPAELPPGDAADVAAADLAALGVPADRGRLDARSGRWGAITPSQPLVPGSGVGNELTWEGLGRPAPANDAALRAAVGTAFRGYLKKNAAELRIDVGETAGAGLATVHDGGAVAQMYVPRVVKGVPVRGSYLTAVINHGNLVLFAANNWGDVDVSTVPDVSAEDALATVQAHVEPFTITGSWGKTEMILVPTARGGELQQVRLGQGYGHRLAWVLRPSFADDLARWEALVDAHTNELISFEDTNQYAEVKGGVFPVTNDGIVPDGVEQPGWPMPFADVGAETTDTGGNFTNTGTVTTDFFGPYVNINDNCGTSSLTGSGVLDWGASGGTDCVTPGFGGAGNTHASRTGFYELNKVIEMARGQLPANSWLQSRLTSNMNINNTCNAFWNGTVNFYRSGGGCANTGEIAGVFDHEWGHGMDANDATPGIASPSGEGIADIYTALRLNTSCIGRNFRLGINCSGNGDPCLNCDGVRDIDYLQRASGQPHDYSWSNANCGGSVHCVGGVYSEAVWSLWKRKLPVIYGYDDNTAHEIVNRLTFIGAGATGTWFSGGPPNGGCAGSSGYMNYLAADDDNGNLNDGTPHMTAIWEAFNDQEIACGTPTVQDAGCAGTPTAAPSVTGTASDKSAGLSWAPVAGATEYEVFRTEGVFACEFGKVKLGATTGTVWNDTGLQNGRDYSYVVIPKGAADSCFGPASSCATVTPAAGPNLAVDTGSAALTITPGDGDAYLDNCEVATMTFAVDNTGLGTLTNVRIVGVTPSNGGVTVSTPFPSAISPSTLAEGATGSGEFSFTAGGLAPGETLTFQVEVTADELAASRFADLIVTSTETDLTFTPSVTYAYEADDEGWTKVQGTFGRSSAGGGAGGTAWYQQSSANLDNQCDQIQSPVMVLSATSTLTLSNQFDIEPFYIPAGVWYDRANIGVSEVATGTRTPVSPDGGRLYNASGANGTCGTTGQGGWADAATNWASSSWSAAALGSAGFAGQAVQLDVRYGTDGSLNGSGFRFDEVTVTDVSFPGDDGQSDTCTPGCTVDADCEDGLFCNGAETCDAGTCLAGSDPCPGQGCDEDTNACVPLACDNDNVCESGEDCMNCPNDCISGSTPGASCGNGLCEAGNGENCLTCA
ncbi:MAG: hypothetical protein OEP45_11515, partial [Acidobacteriota bacterium]|nr:hypothetical protein [Acidobacteriota bacterium]